MSERGYYGVAKLKVFFLYESTPKEGFSHDIFVGSMGGPLLQAFYQDQTAGCKYFD